MTIRVLLADDHAILRTGLRLMLNNLPDVEVVGEATQGREALEKALELKPDLVLMDVTMPEMNGLEATAELKRKLPKVKVLFLTMHEDEELLFRTVQVGGSGYVLKKSADTELIDAIHQVMQGGAFLRPSVMTALAQDYLERVGAGEAQDSYESLTEREREVLKLIAEGNTNPEIARILVISVRTVETHRAHVMEKLGFHHRSELVKYALRKGLLD